jgi:retinol dehydrogenase-12
MPAFSDMTQFFGGQFFGKTFVPDIDLSGKIMVITGANVGLGLEAAKHLYFQVILGLTRSAPLTQLTSARHNVSKLILGCRDIKKGEAAKSRGPEGD